MLERGLGCGGLTTNSKFLADMSIDIITGTANWIFGSETLTGKATADGKFSASLTTATFSSVEQGTFVDAHEDGTGTESDTVITTGGQCAIVGPAKYALYWGSDNSNLPTGKLSSSALTMTFAHGLNVITNNTTKIFSVPPGVDVFAVDPFTGFPTSDAPLEFIPPNAIVGVYIEGADGTQVSFPVVGMDRVTGRVIPVSRYSPTWSRGIRSAPGKVGRVR